MLYPLWRCCGYVAGYPFLFRQKLQDCLYRLYFTENVVLPAPCLYLCTVSDAVHPSWQYSIECRLLGVPIINLELMPCIAIHGIRFCRAGGPIGDRLEVDFLGCIVTFRCNALGCNGRRSAFWHSTSDCRLELRLHVGFPFSHLPDQGGGSG